MILSGGRYTSSLVSEHSNLSGEVTTRQLPDHVTGRSSHACSFYTLGQSQVRPGWLVVLYLCPGPHRHRWL